MQLFELDLFQIVPKLAPLYQRDQSIGSFFHAVCTIVKGSIPIFFEWRKDGNLIKSVPNVNYKIENSKKFSTLTIDEIVRGDGANYSCTAINSIGSDTQSVVLTIKGREY